MYHKMDENGNRRVMMGAWHAPEPKFTSSETFRDIKDCGFDFIHTYYERTDEEIMQTLDACEANGLKYIIGDWGIERLGDDEFDKLPQVVEKYLHHPAFIGNKVKDEPGASYFPRLQKLHAAYKKLYPDFYCYINLFNTYAGPQLLETPTYKEHIDQYVEMVKPEFISFDHYPLYEEDGVPKLNKDFLENFAIVADKCREENLPLWFFVQNIGFNNYYRFPTAIEIAWQMYCAMAFGTEVIQFFCYGTPPNYGEIFHYAMIDREGIKTQQYYRVKRAIHEIQGFDDVFMKYKNVGVMAVAKTGDEDYLFMPHPLASFDPIGSIEEDAPLLIGCFEGKSDCDRAGRKALMIVNMTDPALGIHNNCSIELKGIDAVDMYVKGEKRTVKLSNGKLPLSLSFGEGVFVELPRQ